HGRRVEGHRHANAPVMRLFTNSTGLVTVRIAAVCIDRGGLNRTEERLRGNQTANAISAASAATTTVGSPRRMNLVPSEKQAAGSCRSLFHSLGTCRKDRMSEGRATRVPEFPPDFNQR